MKKILRDLYYGNICPEKEQLNGGPDLDEAVRLYYVNKKKLFQLLEGEEKEIFERYCDAEEDMHEFENVERFVGAMRLGFRLAIELMNGDEEKGKLLL